MRKAFIWVAATTVGMTLSACGDKSSGGGSTGGGTAAVATDPKSGVGVWSADMTPFIAMMKPMLEMGLKAAESMAGTGADPAEAKKELDKAKQKIADLEKMTFVMDLRQGGAAFVRSSEGGSGPEDGVGTWTQAGDQITVTVKTMNGKPAEGNKAEPKTMTLKDGVLTMAEGPFTLHFKRT